MVDIERLRKEADGLAYDFPNYVEANDAVVLDCSANWCPSVAEWAHAAIRADNLCGCLLLSSINHVELEPHNRARQAYDDAVTCLSDGYDLVMAKAEERSIEIPGDDVEPPVPLAQRVKKVKSKLARHLKNPFNHWEPDMFPERFDSRHDPFAERILTRLREARQELEKKMQLLRDLGGDGILSYDEAHPFLDLDDTPHGKGTRWQESCRILTDECMDGIQLTIPWLWFGLTILAYRDPPNYSLLHNVARSRLERFREHILRRPQEDRDVSFFENIRDALSFFSRSTYLPDELDLASHAPKPPSSPPASLEPLPAKKREPGAHDNGSTLRPSESAETVSTEMPDVRASQSGAARRDGMGCMSDPDCVRESAGSLAQKYGLDATRVERLFHRLLDPKRREEALRRYGLEPDDLCERPLQQRLERLSFRLELAMLEGEPVQALDFFEKEPNVFQAIVYRGAALVHLRGASTPLYTLDELTQATEAFIAHLERNRQHLLKTGHPHTEFSHFWWFDMCLGKLYHVKQPRSTQWHRNDSGDMEILYEWTPYGLPVILDGQPVSSDPKCHTVDEQPFSSVSYEEAMLMESIAPEDAERLENERPKIFDLKINILKQLLHNLRRGTAQDLWQECLDLLAETLSAKDMDFYLRMDRFYTAFDVRIGQILGDDPGMLPGGISDLIECIGHFENELTNATMDLTRKDLLAITEFAQLPRYYQYYQAIGQPWRAALDNALDQFWLRTEKLQAFYMEFYQRVNEALAKWFRDDLVVPIRLEYHSFIKRLVLHAEAGLDMKRVLGSSDLKPTAPAGSSGTSQSRSLTEEDKQEQSLSADRRRNAALKQPKTKDRRVAKRIKKKVRELLEKDSEEGGPGFADGLELIKAVERDTRVTGDTHEEKRSTLSKAIGALRDEGMRIGNRPYKLEQTDEE